MIVTIYCFLYCKGTNFKANHNLVGCYCWILGVVSYSAKLLKCKQITK